MATANSDDSAPPEPPIRGVLLDIDDTLVDTRGAFRHALTTMAVGHLRAGVDPEEVTRFWREDRNDWYRAHTRGLLDYREQRMRRANELHAEFGGEEMDDAAYDIWDAQFEAAFRDGWRAFDDVEAFLDRLDAAGIPYGAVSNAAADYQTLKLERCGLSRVPMLVGVDTFGVGKPDPRVFHEGAARLGVSVQYAAYVGDEYDIDAGGAARAGLVGVWLDRPGTRRSTVPDGAQNDPSIVHVVSLARVPRVLGLE